MGNSESNEQPEQPEQPEQRESDNSSLQNNLAIIESVVYIVSLLARIYTTYNNDKDTHRHESHYLEQVREPIFVGSFDWSSTDYSPHSRPKIEQTISSEQLEPVVPEGGEDEPISDDDDVKEPENRVESACVICMSNRIKTVFLPCGHTALCLSCSREYASRELARVNPKLECVICKQPIAQIKQIFTV